jgi:methyl-accepting chemotaxis protein
MSQPLAPEHVSALELSEVRRRADSWMLGALCAGAAVALIQGFMMVQTALAITCAATLCAIGSLLFIAGRGSVLNRCAFPALLMAMVALHIQLSGGRIEYHFGVFVTLAFLLLYRDWMPPLVGAATIAIHHLLFDRLQALGFPVYCLSHPNLPIVLLHAGYVVVQTAFQIVIGLRMRADTLQAHELHQLVGRLQQGDKLALEQQSDTAASPAAGMLKSALQRIASAIGQVDDAASAVGSAAEQLASGQQEVSQRTVSTATSLQQTATSMQQLTNTLQESTRAASHANELATSAAEAARRGGIVVSQVVVNMRDISDSSRRIAEIIGVIDSIAFQTNILALNAAVEAARAGEQGRGFVVVASEVRNLAQRTAVAAREIKELIGASAERVESGTRLVQDAGGTMDEIVDSVQRLTTIMSDLNTATLQQSQRIGAVSQSLGQLDQMTQQNADFVEQSSQASNSLQEQARRLADVVSVFHLQPAIHAN